MRRALVSSDVLLGTVRHLQNASATSLHRLDVLEETGAMELLLNQSSYEAHQLKSSGDDATGTFRKRTAAVPPAASPMREKHQLAPNPNHRSNSNESNRSSARSEGVVAATAPNNFSIVPPYPITGEQLYQNFEDEEILRHHNNMTILENPADADADQHDNDSPRDGPRRSGSKGKKKHNSNSSSKSSSPSNTKKGEKKKDRGNANTATTTAPATTDPDPRRRTAADAAADEANQAYRDFIRSREESPSPLHDNAFFDYTDFSGGGTPTSSGARGMPTTIQSHGITSASNRHQHHHRNSAALVAAPSLHVDAGGSDVGVGYDLMNQSQQHVDRQRALRAAVIAEERRKAEVIVSTVATSIIETVTHADKMFVNWLQRLISVVQETQDEGIFSSGVNINSIGVTADGDCGGGGGRAHSHSSHTAGSWDAVTTSSTHHHQATQASPVSCFEAVLSVLPNLLHLLVRCHNIPLIAAREAENVILTFMYRVVVSLAEFPEEVERATVGTAQLRDYETNNHANNINYFNATTSRAANRTTSQQHQQQQQAQEAQAASSVVSFKTLFAQLLTPHLPFLLSAATLQMKSMQRQQTAVRCGPPVMLFQSAAQVDERTGVRELIPNVVHLTVADDYFWVSTFTIAVFGGDRLASFLISRRCDFSDEPFQEVIVQSASSCVSYAVRMSINKVMRASGLVEAVSEPALPLAGCKTFLPEVCATAVYDDHHHHHHKSSSSSSKKKASSSSIASKSRSLLKITMDDAAFIAHLTRVLTRVVIQLPNKVHLPTVVGTLSAVSWLGMTMATIDPSLPIPLRYAGDVNSAPQQGPMAQMTRMVVGSATGLATSLASNTPAESFIPAQMFSTSLQQCVNAIVMLFVAWNLQISHATPLTASVSAPPQRVNEDDDIGSRSVRTVSMASEYTHNPSAATSAVESRSESRQQQAFHPYNVSVPQQRVRSPATPPPQQQQQQQNKFAMEFKKHEVVLSRLMIKLLATAVGGGGGGSGHVPFSTHKLFSTTAEEAELQRFSCRAFLRAIAEAHHLTNINTTKLTNAVNVSKLPFVVSHHHSSASDSRPPNSIVYGTNQYGVSFGDCFMLLNTTLRCVLLETSNNAYAPAAQHHAQHNSIGGFVSGTSRTATGGWGGGGGGGNHFHQAPLSAVWHVNMWKECLRIATLHSHLLCGGEGGGGRASALKKSGGGGGTSPAVKRTSSKSPSRKHRNTDADDDNAADSGKKVTRTKSKSKDGKDRDKGSTHSPSPPPRGGPNSVGDHISQSVEMVGGVGKMMQQHEEGDGNQTYKSPSRSSCSPTMTTCTSNAAHFGSSVDPFEADWNLASTALRLMDPSSDGTLFSNNINHCNYQSSSSSSSPLLIGSLATIVGTNGTSSSRMGLHGISNANNTFKSGGKHNNAATNDDWSDYSSWAASHGRGGRHGGGGAAIVSAATATNTPQSLLDRLARSAEVTRQSQHKIIPLATLSENTILLSGELIASFRYLNGCLESCILHFDPKRHVTNHRVCNGFELAAEYLTAYANLISKTASLPNDTFAAHFHQCASGFYRLALEKVQSHTPEEDNRLFLRRGGGEDSPASSSRGGAEEANSKTVLTMKQSVLENLHRRIIENDVDVARRGGAASTATTSAAAWGF